MIGRLPVSTCFSNNGDRFSEYRLLSQTADLVRQSDVLTLARTQRHLFDPARRAQQLCLSGAFALYHLRGARQKQGD